MTNDQEVSEVDQLHRQIHRMSNTIEAMKNRCIELEFQIIDLMAERVGNENALIERMRREQAESQLPDGDDH